MANLIITIISIALVAVAALMAAYYGGTAYSNAQMKARANEVIGRMTQLKAAAHIWQANNGVACPTSACDRTGWWLALQNGNYLQIPMSVNDFMPDLTWSSEFSGRQQQLVIQARTDGVVYVYWFLAGAPFAVNGDMVNLCARINEILRTPYAGTVSSYYSGNIPYEVTPVPDTDIVNLNMCSLQGADPATQTGTMTVTLKL